MRYRFWHVAALVAALLCLMVRPSFAAGDPYLEWWTIHTPHARIHYYKGLEPIAERAADLLESMHDELGGELGWKPTQITEVVLTDNSDNANGSATGIPYNTMRLFVTAPGDMSPLGDHDDWYHELISHEFTHILHVDNISGAPAVVNAILGRTLVPNQSQPRWILEGMAVIQESRHSTAGRMRSTMFDMYLRGDVIDDRIVPLDQMSHSPRRWPQGNIWYLYGSRFLGWITDTYGHEVLGAIAADTGSQLIPYGINRTIRRATGRTYEELYPAWVAHLKKHYARQLQPVLQKGLREGVRLTHHGRDVSYPRFVPRPARSSNGYGEVIYYRADGSNRGGLYRLVLETSTKPRGGSEELVARTSGSSAASFAPDGSLYFNSLAPTRRVYAFGDIHRLPPGETAPSGLESSVDRLTFGHRARYTDVSPDGRTIAFTVTHRGTSYLKTAPIRPDGSVGESRTLVGSARFEQAYTPRFSPDGKTIAYSVWTRGGYRDIRLVEVKTGKFRQLMYDRTMDMQPTFTPDGRYLLFSSDRTGIANIYAYELDSRRLYQVTNVRTGAYQPAISPNGKTLVYVGYTSYGYDLFALPLDPSKFFPAPAVTPDRSQPDVYPRGGPYRRTRYNPLPSLRPRSLTLEYGPGTYGQALTVETIGSDAVGHHAVTAFARFETEQTLPFVSLGYSYNRLPFDYFSTVFRSLAPRKGFRINDQEPIWLERSIGWTNGIVYTKPGSFDSQSYAMTYTISQVDGELPVGPRLDPYATVGVDPLRGYVGVLRFAWAYNTAEQELYSVGPERGFTLGAAVDVGDHFTASEYSVYSFSYQATKYLQVPWLKHHSIALHAGGAAATGDYPRRGLFFVGGFLETTLQDVIRNTIFQGGFVLRGYEPIAFVGSQYHLGNVEYRFPIANIDRGPSTLPFFFRRISGNLFIDYGGAFDRLDIEKWRDQFHTGVGGELWVDVQAGYFGALNVRLGYARGFGDFAVEGGQKYMVIAAPF